jgi:hypothetical protein
MADSNKKIESRLRHCAARLTRHRSPSSLARPLPERRLDPRWIEI